MANLGDPNNENGEEDDEDEGSGFYRNRKTLTRKVS